MSVALWLLVGLPGCGAAAAALLPRLRRAIAAAAALATALWALLIVDGLAAGTAASAPWIPSRGLELRLLFDPLAIPGVLLTCVGTLAALLDPRTPTSRLPALLLGAALALSVWLAGDLGLLVAALGGLGLLAALLARGRGPAAIAVALPLGVGAASIALGVLLLALGCHEAASGELWTFDRIAVLAATAPPGAATPATAALVFGAWLLAGTWPLDGWWRAAAGAAPHGVDAWIPAMIRPLGLWVLIRVALPAGGAVALDVAPALAWVAAIGVGVAVLAALAAPGRRERAISLAEIPLGLATVGAWTITAEGTAGALLLLLGGGLALPLALDSSAGPRVGPDPDASADPRAGASSRADHGPDASAPVGPAASAEPKPGTGTNPRVGPDASAEPRAGASSSTDPGTAADHAPDASAEPRSGSTPRVGLLGLLGLAGAPGLVGAAGALLVILAVLGQGRWFLAGPLWIGGILSAAVVAGIAAALRRGAPAIEPPTPPLRGRAGAILLVVALVALGLRPGLLLDRLAPASAAWMSEVHARICVDLLAPALRPTLAAPPAACEAPIPAVRTHLQEARP